MVMIAAMGRNVTGGAQRLAAIATFAGWAAAMTGPASAQPPPPAMPVQPVQTAPISAEPPPSTGGFAPANAAALNAPYSGITYQAAAAGTKINQYGTRSGGRTEDDLLLFQVWVGRLLLAEDLAGFISGSSVLLPLGEFMDVVDFPITVDAADGIAQGWFIKENRWFSLNLGKNSLVINGKDVAFDRSLIEIHGNEIYVDIRMLPDWFPIEYSFDLSNLILELKPQESLPIQLKAQRQNFRKRIFGRPETQTEKLPRAESPPRLIGVPTADIDLTSVFNKSGSATSTVRNSYTAQVSGELLYSSLDMFVSGVEKNNLSDLRVKLDRKDPDGQALGAGFADTVPLAITDFSVGDINPVQLPMISRSRIGRGVQLSNAPLNARTEFDRVTLEGDLVEGWEIELYRNEILIDFLEESTNGRYSFEDVPLLFGRNVIKLVFYGPQGQRREETEIFNVGADQLPVGAVRYRIALNEHDRRMFTRLEDPDNDFEGRNRAVGQVQMGITPALSALATIAHVPIRTNSTSRPYTYVGGGLRFGYSELIGRMDIVNQVDRGWAAKFAAQTRVSGVSVSAEHDIYRRFISEQVDDNADQTLISRTKLRFSGAIPQTFLPRIPVNLDADYERKTGGGSQLTVVNRLSAALGPFSVSNTSTFRKNFNPDSANTTTGDSSLLLSGRFDNIRLRGQAGYSTLPQFELDSFNITADWFLSKTYQPQAGFSRSFGSSRFNTYILGLNIDYPFALIGLNATYQSNGTFTSRMNTSFSLSRDPNSGRFDISSNEIGRSGMVSVLVFLDKDLNGSFSDGDKPLEGVRFRYRRGGSVPGQTGSEGSMLITGLPVYEESELIVDLGSLGDPFLQTEPEGISLVPRPGGMVSYEFPVVSSGEVDGTVTWLQKPEGPPGPVSRIAVQVVRPDGKVIREERTAFDGFYLLDFIKPGKYTLRVSPEDLGKLGLLADREMEIEITGEGTILNGRDFLLTPDPNKPKEPPAAPDDSGAVPEQKTDDKS